jgi:tRNA pseudouridine38-40 synthase
MRVCLKIKYLGGKYAGSQRQINSVGIQNLIDDELSELYRAEVRTVASGRTDRGVHAEEQVLLFRATPRNFPLAKLPLILNMKLPEDIRILSAEEAHPDFHPRFVARVRMYRYRLIDRVAPMTSMPEWDHLAYFPRLRLEEEKLFAYLQPLIGQHDFTAFCSAKDPSPSKVREMFHLSVWRDKQIVNIDFYGNAFLQTMIRSIVGNLLAAYRHQAPADALEKILISKDRSLAKLRAPANGLSLKKVFYSKVFGHRDYYVPYRKSHDPHTSEDLGENELRASEIKELVLETSDE